MVRELLRRPGFEEAISATTRPPRPGERDGRDYHFWTPARFRRAIRRGELAEWARIYGHLYGTPKASLLDAIRRGRVVIRNVDVRGWRALRRLKVRRLGVFLLPPSLRELRRRMESRGTDDPVERERRWNAARAEMRHRFEYDVRVVNDDVRACANRIARALGRIGVRMKHP